ncbi:hypothetical protein ABK040_001308 [Willaertia magna]
MSQPQTEVAPREESNNNKKSVTMGTSNINEIELQEDSNAYNNTVAIDIPTGTNHNEKDNKSVASKTSKASGTESARLSTNGLVVRIDTSCGAFELSPMKLCSLVGMLLTVFAFVVLAVCLTTTFVFQNYNDVEILIVRGDIKSYRDTLTSSCYLAYYSDMPNFYIDLYNQTNIKYLDSFEYLQKIFPEGFKDGWLNKYVGERSLSTLEQRMLSDIENGRKQQAGNLLFSNLYIDLFGNFSTDFDKALSLAIDSQRDQDKSVLISASVGLAVIIVALFTLVPIMIGIFALAFNRESVNLRRIKNANAIMLMDTMSNDKLREIFKKHCETEYSLENFKFLEKVTLYKRLCEQSFEIQEKLYGTDSSSNDNLSHVESSTTNNSNTSKSSNGKVSEKDLKNIEKKKYEMAFDIYTDFLDVRGGNSVNISKHFIEEVKTQLDNFNTGVTEILPEVLFNNAAREISIVMLDTHQRFKASLAFQKQMKIKGLDKKKTKKQKE